MNGEGRPEAELLLREMQSGADHRKGEQGDGVEHEDRSERDGHLLIVGLGDGADGGDGTASADGCAGGDQKRSDVADSEEMSEGEACGQGGGDADGGVEESGGSRVEDLVQIHAEAEHDDRDLEEKSRELAGVQLIGMSDREAVEQAAGERDGRRNKTASRNNQTKEERILCHCL
jgi:hypothetical protein